MFVGGSYNTYIGRGLRSQTDAWLTFEGCMSHFHCSTGYTYDASAFGSTDSTTGEWQINTSPSITMGTDGFTVLKDGNTITDQSSNSNNFTVYSGTLTKTEDCPSNVFATLNSLSKGIDQTLSNGNTTMVSGTATSRTPTQTTLGMSSGKYYAEFKITTSDNTIPGIVNTQDNSSVSRGTKYYPGSSSDGWGYTKAPDVRNNSSAVGGTWSTFAVGDIIGVAINLDNTQGGLNKLYFSKNGVWQNGTDPTDFDSVVGVVGVTPPASVPAGAYFFVMGDAAADSSSKAIANFGNPDYANSSSGADANGFGDFEYAPPTGFYSICTKNLAEFG